MTTSLNKIGQLSLTIITLIIVFLYVFAESNYIQNKNILFDNSSLNELILSSFAILLILWSFPSKSQRKWLQHGLSTLKFLVIFSILFMVFIEAAIVDFSGMLFGPEAIVHFSWDAFVLGLNEYLWPFFALIVFLVLTVMVLVSSSHRLLSNKTQWGLFILSVLLLSFSFTHSVLGRYTKGIKEYMHLSQIQDVNKNEILKFKPLGISALDVNKLQISTSGGNNKNLIVIYLESFSDIFTTSSQHPNLTPNINRLKSDYVSINPYISTAGFTMDGLIGSLCGFLPNMALGNNALTGSDKHYYFIPCLSDVLREAQYHQEFIGGAKKNFANKGTFLLDHGYNRVWGWEDFKNQEAYQKPQSHSWWGLHDDDLFDLTISRINKLKDKKQPFHISVLTLSTHLKGFSAPSCKPYGIDADRYINSIHCSDQLLGQFIDQLKSDGILDDTVVFITGDHGVFNTSLTKSLFGEEISNKNILGIMIDKTPDNTNLPLGLYDMAPVLLDRLDINHNVNFINGQSNASTDDRLLVTRTHAFQNGQPLKLNSKCKKDDELDANNLSVCAHRNSINALHGYTQQFKLDKSHRYTVGSNLKVVFSEDKTSIKAINFNGTSVKKKFTRNGFKLTEYHFGTNDVFYIQFDSNKKTIGKTFLLDKLKRPFKTIEYLSKQSDFPFVVFGTKHSLDNGFKEKLNHYSGFTCLNDEFCYYKMNEITTLEQNLNKTEVSLTFKN